MPKRRWATDHYHVYNRGFQRSAIFHDNRDRTWFLSKLDEFCQRDEQVLLAYCLMDNHYHLALWQRGDIPLSKTMQSLLAGYTQHYNHRYGTTGTLFQGRFAAKPIWDEGAMANLTRYIHLNPHPYFDYQTYRWSSYRQYSQPRPGIAEVGPVLDTFGGSRTSYTIFCEKVARSGSPRG
jgi:putative transposase